MRRRRVRRMGEGFGFRAIRTVRAWRSRLVSVPSAVAGPAGPGSRRGRAIVRWLAAGVALTVVSAGAVGVSGGGSAAAQGSGDPPWMDTGLSPDERADLLLVELTIQEKVSLMHGSGRKNVGDEFWQWYLKGIERVGMPDVTVVDGAAGVRSEHGSTQPPSPIALGASWSRETAAQYGDLIGQETRLAGYNVLNAPTINLIREPLHGRTFESFSEDPYLMGQLAVPEVRAIQGHDVIANVKHYAVNNIEKDRRVLDVQVDERTLNELYLPHFKDVVREGDVASVMCSYNKVNGVWACDNEMLLTEMLRERWGLEGYVRNDFTAFHTLESAQRGMDLEGPHAQIYAEDMVDAVRSGRVSEAVVDQAVHRILRTLFAYGAFDNPPERVEIPAEHVETARELAEDTIVLLKNAGGALPLDPDAGQSIAVIGADANTAETEGGGSVPIDPAIKDTIVDAIQERAPEATVNWAPGVDPVAPASNVPGFDIVPSGVLTAADGETPGLTATYYSSRTFTNPIQTRVEPGVYLDDGWYATGGTTKPRPPGGAQTVRWTGTFAAPVDGEYTFDLASFDPSRLYVDGELLIDNSGQHDDTPKIATVSLEAGQPHDVRIDYEPFGPNPFRAVNPVVRRIKFGWQPPAAAVDANVAEAAALAADSDVAVVVVRDYMSEVLDRPKLGLPNNQDTLVREVAEANPNTIVVATTGGAISMPWIEDVPAVVEAWYGGAAHGAALARVLFGDVNPSGRLPITFPERHEDMPTAAPEQFPGVDRVAEYSEGLSVGYRHYEATGTEPLFAFGHGLSYTRFDYANIELDRDAFIGAAAAAHGGLEDEAGVTVSFDVTNTGDRAGAVVPQAYVESPRAAETPSKQLKGFEKVWLEPGQTEGVSIDLNQQAFARYDADADQWRVPSGRYQVQVGDSAQDTRLTTTVNVTRTVGAPHVQLTAEPLATPGEELRVTGTLVNDGDFPLTRVGATGLDVTLDVPGGWTATGGNLPATVGPHSEVPVEWTVQVPADASPEAYQVKAQLAFRAGPSDATSTTRATTHVPVDSLAAAFNNAGITDEGGNEGDPELGDTLLANGFFTDGTSNWTIQNIPDAAVHSDGGPDGNPSLLLPVTASENTRAFHPGLPVVEGQRYQIDFQARANTDGATMRANVMQAHSPFQNSGFDQEVTLGPDWQEFSFDFTANVNASENNRVTFSAFQAGVDYEVAMVQLRPILSDDEGGVQVGDLDGGGRSLSAQALAGAGYLPGEPVTAAGVTFTWPETTPGEPDNVGAAGQAIRLDGTGDAVHLLGTGTQGPVEMAGDLTVVYTDGTTETTSIQLSEWWGENPQPGTQTAVTFPYVNTSTNCPQGSLVGTACQREASLYVVSVPADPSREVSGVVLPRLAPDPTDLNASGTMHIFAATVSD